MRDREGMDEHRARNRARAPLAAAAAVAVLAVAAISVASCQDQGMQFWRGGDASSDACPRPPSFTGPEFNAQETGLRYLR